MGQIDTVRIRIKELEDQMQAIEINIDSFSKYGRQARKEERYEQIRLLTAWREYDIMLTELKFYHETPNK